MMSFALMAALVLIPLYLQLVVGQSPMQAAMVVTPQIGGMVLSSAIGARLASGSGRVARLLLAGVLFQAVGIWSLVVGTGLALPAWIFSVVSVLLGGGMGLGMPNAITLVQNAVRRDQLGVATGSVSFFRSLGGAAGVALSGGVVAFMLRARLEGGHFGIAVRALLEQGIKAASRLSPVEHARYVDAYRHAIETGFVLCAVFITGALVWVLFLPNDRGRGRREELNELLPADRIGFRSRTTTRPRCSMPDPSKSAARAFGVRRERLRLALAAALLSVVFATAPAMPAPPAKPRHIMSIMQCSDLLLLMLAPARSDRVSQPRRA